MPAQPDNHQHEAEATAALLLLGMRYNLPALIRAQRIRPRPFRPIRPTAALKYDLAAPYYDIVRAWSAQTPAIVSAYANGASQAATDRAAMFVSPVVNVAQQSFDRIIANLERWHRAQWVQRVKTATGLDVSMFTRPDDVRQAAQAATDWNRRLATDVSAEIERKAASEIAAGTSAGLPAEQVAEKIKAAVAAGKQRAARIGDDQVEKASGAMGRQRRIAAGVGSYMWVHSPHVIRPRAAHLARNRMIFGNDEIPPDDRCGVPYGCQCYEVPVLQ
jgi:uncharacterized protein with gpF-like domain